MDAERYTELARAAFPAGFLPVRGVKTIGGWTCMRADWCDGGDVPGYATEWRMDGCVFVWPYWVHKPDHRECPDVLSRQPAEATHAAGELLPDYADPLTRYAIWLELAALLRLWTPGGWYGHKLRSWEKTRYLPPTAAVVVPAGFDHVFDQGWVHVPSQWAISAPAPNGPVTWNGAEIHYFGAGLRDEAEAVLTEIARVRKA